jgi:hypothetical protein
MKLIKFNLFIFFRTICWVFSIENQGNLGLEVFKSHNQEIMGENVGFYTKFKIKSKKSIEAIDYNHTKWFRSSGMIM